MLPRIESIEKENLEVINAIVNYLAKYDVQTLKNVAHMLDRLFTKKEYKEKYIWGESGSHVWLSQKEDGNRIMIFI